MKTKKKFRRCQLEMEWKFPEDWSGFLEYWEIDPEETMKIYRNLRSDLKCKAIELPTFKTYTSTLTFRIETPNYTLAFFIEQNCKNFSITSVSKL